MAAGQGKTKAPMLAFLPRSSNAMVRAWLKYYRPVLTKVRMQSYAVVVFFSLSFPFFLGFFLGLTQHNTHSRTCGSESGAPVRVRAQERDRSTRQLLGAAARAAARLHRQECGAAQFPRHAGQSPPPRTQPNRQHARL